MRRNYGCPLETLELGNCAHAIEADVDLLAEIVADVGWDGWDSDEDALELQMGNVTGRIPDVENYLVSFSRAETILIYLPLPLTNLVRRPR